MTDTNESTTTQPPTVDERLESDAAVEQNVTAPSANGGVKRASENDAADELNDRKKVKKHDVDDKDDDITGRKADNDVQGDENDGDDSDDGGGTSNGSYEYDDTDEYGDDDYANYDDSGPRPNDHHSSTPSVCPRTPASAHSPAANRDGRRDASRFSRRYNNPHATVHRHSLASWLGAGAMRKVDENLYVEPYDSRISHRVTISTNVCRCTPDRKCMLCDACFCRYHCTCQDYWCHFHVCVHSHATAALRCGRRALQPRPRPPPPPFEMRNAGSRWPAGCHNRSERAHERGSTMARSHIRLVGRYEWRVHDETVTRRPVNLQQCVCRVKATDSNRMVIRCRRCRICIHDYKCSCAEYANPNNRIICYHIHAVARQFVSQGRPHERGSYAATVRTRESAGSPSRSHHAG